MKHKRKKQCTAHKDPLSVQKSREHGRAIRRGIEKAKNIKHAVLKAASQSRGMSKAEVASGMFAAGEEGEPESPSVAAARREARERKKKKSKTGTIASAFARSREWKT